MTDHVKNIKEALALFRKIETWTQDKYGRIRTPDNETLRVTGVSLPCGIVRADDPCHANTALIAACNPEAIIALLGELEAAKKNEARYLWLRGTDHNWLIEPSQETETPDDEEKWAPEALDAAIDAAIKGATP